MQWENRKKENNLVQRVRKRLLKEMMVKTLKMS